MSLYILEGPRSSGKTTVVNQLKSVYKDGRISVIKFNRTSDPPTFMTNFLAKNYLAIIDSRSICVLDRFHLTEFVMRSLDKKVPEDILNVTTSMIDVMLKHCGAVTYVLQASQLERRIRGKKRDEAHSKPEWENIDELDAMWAIAIGKFHKSNVKVMPSNTPDEVNKIVSSIMAHQRREKTVQSKVPLLAPIVYGTREMEVA